MRRRREDLRRGDPAPLPRYRSCGWWPRHPGLRRLLQESTHPDVMRTLCRDRVLDLPRAISYQDPVRERLGPRSRRTCGRTSADLHRLPGEPRSVPTSAGERLPDMLTGTGSADVREKLDQLSPKDQATQEGSSRRRSRPGVHRRGLVLPAVDRAYGPAATYGAPAEVSTDNGRWRRRGRSATGSPTAPSVTVTGRLARDDLHRRTRRQVQQINHDLYSGYAGSPYFSASYARITR